MPTFLLPGSHAALRSLLQRTGASRTQGHHRDASRKTLCLPLAFGFLALAGLPSCSHQPPTAGTSPSDAGVWAGTLAGGYEVLV